MKSLIGTKLGQYEIVEKIGQGGMAHVFKAYQASLDRYVAMKILSPILAEQPGFTERFQREAHSVANLHHPNILQVYDFGVHNSYNYLVMRYVKDSVTLSHLIQQEMTMDKLIDYILQVADALNYAHEYGVIHRDVKPSNILIDNKWALLSDFGLVKMIEGSTHLTNTGMGIGTPAYMSPEQVTGSKNLDRRTDIYALGIIMYRLLTGTIPHDAPTPIAVLAKRGSEPVPPLRQIKPTVSPSFEQVTMRSLAMDPNVRYSTATDFAEALKQAQTNPDYQEPTLTITEQPTMASKLQQPDKPKKNNVALMAGGAIAALLILGAIAFFLFFPFDNGRSSANSTPPQTGSSGTPASLVNAPPTATPMPPTATPVPPGTPSAIANTDLEVHTGPGEEYDLIGYLPEGASAEITSRDQAQAWWQIKTPLSPNGTGWVRAGSDFTQAVDIDNVPIALAPPTPTPSSTDTPPPDTPTSTPTAPPNTPTPTDTPTRPPSTATPTASTSGSTARPTPTPTPAVPTGEFTLLRPISLEKPTFGVTEFEWQWSGDLREDQGFEVRVWRDGEPPAGVHNAVLDNQNGTIEALGNNRYRLVADITDAFGVKGRGGEYNWTVAVVQIEPEYQDLGIAAPPARLRYDAPGGGGDGGDDGGGGGGQPSGGD